MESEAEPVRELRRGYHDRIAELREQSLSILGTAIELSSRAGEALLGSAPDDPDYFHREATSAARVVGGIDGEAVSLLALEAPVARDLRVILASRDVAQIGLLCVGLAVTLAGRSACASTIAAQDLTGEVARVSQAALDLLRAAEGAWATLDEDTAGSVFDGLGTARQARLDFFAALLKLSDVPIEVALDLGMAARVYDRLIDHAAEIAGRVVFAISGQTKVASPPE